MGLLGIGDLEINPRITAAIKNAGFHDGRMVLNVSSAELERLTGLSASDVTQLKDAIAEAVLGCHAVTGLQMWREELCETTQCRKLSTGCKVLDQALRGGVLLRGITEVAGESGAGKTQLCLQLCLTVQLPVTHGGLNGRALYISTEGAFPNKRLSQMAGLFSQQYSSVLKHRVMDHILLEHVAELEGLRDCLQKKLPLALARQRVRLVVVDSVAALFRGEHDGHSLKGRAKQLASLAVELRRVAEQHDMAVVCVNQVTANMSKVCEGPGKLRQSLPALGLVWADHITCRFFMSRPQDTLSTPTARECQSEEASVPMNQRGLVPTTKRQLEIVFAPHLAQCVIPLVINQRGISHESVGV